MKKIVIILVIFLIIVIGFIFGYRIYNKYRVEHAKKIVKLNVDKVDVFKEVTLEDLIYEINGKLIKNKKIDTTTIGKKKVSFNYINDDNIKVPYTIEIEVIDRNPPLIKKFSSYSTTVGNDKFYDKFFCGDNYDDKPKCSIEGEYDINTPGLYDVTFKGEDSSGNISENRFTLIVKEPPKNSSSKSDKKKEVITTDFDEVLKKYKKNNNKIGIDVSHFQGDIDFEKVKNSGVEFVYIRVGRGGGVGKKPVLDDKFKQNIEGFNKVKIPVGIYFYSYAVNEKEAVKDAKWVIKQIKDYKVDLEVAYDFEDWIDFSEYNLSFYHLSQTAEAFNNKIKEAGYTGMLYSSKYYLENIWFKTKHPIWLAHYTDNTDYDGDYKVWQLCENGKVDGIKDNMVDIDIMY